jgi:hypothetical protein
MVGSGRRLVPGLGPRPAAPAEAQAGQSCNAKREGRCRGDAGDCKVGNNLDQIARRPKIRARHRGTIDLVAERDRLAANGRCGNILLRRARGVLWPSLYSARFFPS